MKIIIEMPVGWTFDQLTNVRRVGMASIYRLHAIRNKDGRLLTTEGATVAEAVQLMSKEMTTVEKETKNGRDLDQ